MMADRLTRPLENVKVEDDDSQYGVAPDKASPRLYDPEHPYEHPGYLSGSNGAGLLGNLDTMVRDNPVPLVLMGAGLAWLMLSGSRSRRGRYYEDNDLLDEYAEVYYGAGDYPAGDYPAGHYLEENDEAVFGETPRGYEPRSGGKSFVERAKRTAEAARRRAQRLRAGGEPRAYGLSEDARDNHARVGRKRAREHP